MRTRKYNCQVLVLWRLEPFCSRLLACAGLGVRKVDRITYYPPRPRDFWLDTARWGLSRADPTICFVFLIWLQESRINLSECAPSFPLSLSDSVADSLTLQERERDMETETDGHSYKEREEERGRAIGKEKKRHNQIERWREGALDGGGDKRIRERGMYIYIYMHACWTAASGSTWHLPRKPVQGPQKIKNRFFLQNGAFWVTVRGPPNSQLEGHRASLKMRRECGPWTGSPVGPEPAFKLVIFDSFFRFPHFAWNPNYFYSVLYKLQFKMLKFEAQFWSKFQTLENQFELLSGRFVDPELPFKISPRIQAKKKTKRHHKKTTTTRNPNASFCRKERFQEKKGRKLRFFLPLVCWPFCAKGL